MGDPTKSSDQLTQRASAAARYFASKRPEQTSWMASAFRFHSGGCGLVAMPRIKQIGATVGTSTHRHGIRNQYASFFLI
jgi:hypothetical protein